MKKIRCILGLHKYDKSKEKKSLIYEKKGEYFYRYDNECIYCGHHKTEIHSFGGSKQK